MRPYFKYVNSSISEDLNRHPLPTDGPEVKRIDHSAHVTTSKEVKDCSKCGDKLAKYFLQKLRIGKIIFLIGKHLNDFWLVGWLVGLVVVIGWLDGWFLVGLFNVVYNYLNIF